MKIMSGVAVALVAFGHAFAVLPPGYEAIPCIVADGTQYLDTGYTPTSTNMGFYLDFQYGGVVSKVSDTNFFHVLGSSWRNSGNWGGVVVSGYAQKTGGQMSFCGYTGEGGVMWDPGLSDGRRVQLELKSLHYRSSSGLDYDITTTYAPKFYGNVYLGSIHYEEPAAANRRLTGSIYRLKFYEGDEIVHDFVPVRTPSGEVGLYDVKGNLGLRTSVTGSPYAAGTETLQFLEYVEATGTQYLDTGYTPTWSDVGFYLDFRYDNEIATSGHAQILGSSDRNGGSWGGLVLNGYKTRDGGQFGLGRRDPIADPHLVKGERIQLELMNHHYESSTGATVDFQEALTGNPPLFHGSVYLGKIHYEESPANTMSGRIYRFKLYKKSTIVRDYRPALRLSDGKAGFYEVVNDEFVESAGANPYIAGPALCEVEVASVRPDVGSVSTSYGACEVATGTVFRCVADPYWTNESTHVQYACLGWTLKDVSGAILAATNSLTFELAVPTNASQILEWNWTPCKLAEGYTLLQSIQSTGTQAADLGIMPVKTTRVVYDFRFTEVPSSSTRALSGWGSSSSTDAFLWGHMESQNKGCAGYFSSSVGSNWVFSSTGVLLDADRHVFDLLDGAQSFDGVLYGQSRTAPRPNTMNCTDQQHLYVAALHGGWTSGQYNDTRYGCVTGPMTSEIYGCRVYDGSVLSADFVPCMRMSDSVAGLYNACTGDFIPSMVANTAFVAGPVARVRPPLPPRGSLVLFR